MKHTQRKILFLGEIRPGQTTFMRMRALERLGHCVRGVNTVEPWKRISWFKRQLQRKLQHGAIIDEINASILNTARELRPDLVWAEKQEFLRVETIRELTKLGARVVHFTPDPYFTLDWKRTPLMDDAIGAFDVLVYCKSYERKQYAALGKPLVYMPLGYCDEIHRPIPSSDACWSCMVGFLGGWEPRRETLLKAVASSGLDLKIWGGYWDFLADGKWTLRRYLIHRQLAGGEAFRIHRDVQLASLVQGNEVYGNDYAQALSSAKIGLGFLRKVCPDQHTTRSFEIPACGSLLLGDRTDEHRELFEEGVEAEFFSSELEMLDKLRFYSRNEALRVKVAAAGKDRCHLGGYSYIKRLEKALMEINTFLA